MIEHVLHAPLARRLALLVTASSHKKGGSTFVLILDSESVVGAIHQPGLNSCFFAVATRLELVCVVCGWS